MMVTEMNVICQHNSSPIKGEPHGGELNGAILSANHYERRASDCDPMSARHESNSMHNMSHHPDYMNDMSNHSFRSLSPAGDGHMDLAGHLKRKELFSQRKQREFIPDNKKDDSYWDRRRRNNEAAKRSREKRRFNDMVLERRVVELTKENHILKTQLEAIKDKYGICGDAIINVEQLAMPTNGDVLSMANKRAKLTNVAAFSPAVSPHLPHIPTTNVPNEFRHVIKSPSPASAPRMTNNMHADQFIVDDAYNPYRYHPSMLHANHYEHARDNGAHALNLSRTRSRPQSPYEVSSGASGDDECSPHHAPQSPVNHAENNSLPLKLRHKSHLGDKDAASALLALQNIKQEPCARASPPWDRDTEGSSDERDSGISLGSDWPAGALVSAVSKIQSLQKRTLVIDEDPEKMHMEIARLASEVANLKSIIQNKS